MFQNNPLIEPRREFDQNSPDYVDYTDKTEQRPKTQQLEQPFGYIFCLNLQRRAELALLDWLGKIPDSADAQILLNCIMLTQDYMIDTVSIHMGYADERVNERADKLLRQTEALIEKMEGTLDKKPGDG